MPRLAAPACLRLSAAALLLISAPTFAALAPPTEQQSPRPSAAEQAELSLHETPIFAVENGDEGPLLTETDRPGLLDRPYNMPRGGLQIETGPAVGFDEDDDTDTDSLLVAFPTLVRFGLIDQLELRLESDIYNILQVDSPLGDADEEGFADIALGAKLRVTKGGESSVIPASALIGMVGLPTGEDPFSTDDPTYELEYVAGWCFGHCTGVVLEGGVFYADFGDGYEGTGQLGAELNHLFVGRTRVFGEALWLIEFDTDAEDSVFVGGGVRHRLNDRIEVDFSVDYEVADGGPDWLFAGGISLLLR